MEFFILFILNIFTGAVIYLMLSLKIERTSATFQEKKLKKEMGEIITEFNSTAERNVTLLENRINILRKLLNEKGDIRGIDLIVNDDKVKNLKQQNLEKESNVHEYIPDSREPAAFGKKDVSTKVKSKSDGSILVGLIDKISNLSRDEKNKENSGDSGVPVKETGAGVDYLVDSEIDFSYDTDDLNNGNPEINSSGQNDVVEDIAVLFSNTADKYSLISDLHRRGYSVDDISRYSGLPSGEVRLVISLNN
ncbi:MAG TPA: hypothetical protein PK358_03500 [Spirochaetota bacterium]|nr:hypothetical protein [Spirochaetota bacterium]HPJ33871.1 hypothetical protein [Spirochaetota bacterium]